MEEAFLQFIWQFQSFSKSSLKTCNGEPVNIIKPGLPNTDAGPDFWNGYVVIDDIEWFGHIEIHNKSSDWYKHKHEESPTYDNVILHVVLENDINIRRKDGSLIPTIEIKDRIDFDLYSNFKDLISSISTIPCHYKLPEISSQLKYLMLDNALIQRLQKKGHLVISQWKDNNNDWEETAYQLLAKNFGFKTNSDAFYDLSKALPYKVIKKHSDNLLQVEALLFGMAGLIPDQSLDDYTKLLKREYEFLSHKYGLSANELNKGRWKFLRLRPANFPTIRISQFAAVLVSMKNLFSNLISIKDIEEATELFTSATSEYWKKRYNFSKPSSSTIPGIGSESIENIIINTLCPLLSAYRINRDQQEYLDKALHLLENTKPEKNKITRLYGTKAFLLKNAMDSQGLIELYQSFCAQKNCLGCQIGISIIREPREAYKKTLKSAM